MKPKALIQSRIDALKSEAARYEQLAKDNALRAFLNPDDSELQLKIQDHLIRAETFKEAARIIAQPSA